MTPGKVEVGAIGFHSVLLLLVTSWNFRVLVLLVKPKMPWALKFTWLEPGAVPTVAIITGVQAGVGVGVGVWLLVGVGFGVVEGGGPAHTLIPMMDVKLTAVVVLLELPPPQLMISAAARKDSTGTSTRHRRRQIIEH